MDWMERLLDNRSMVVDRGYPLQAEEGKDRYRLSSTIYVMHGCDGCEFKVIGSCPFGYRVGDKGHSEVDYSGRNYRICQEKINWLKGFIPDDCTSKMISYSRWMEFMQLVVGNKQSMLDYARYTVDDTEYRKLLVEFDIMVKDKSNGGKDKIKEMRSRLDEIRNRMGESRGLWEGYQDKLLGMMQNRQRRIEPSKVEIKDERKLTISDIDRILRDNSIEVEGKEVNDNG